MEASGEEQNIPCHQEEQWVALTEPGYHSSWGRKAGLGLGCVQLQAGGLDLGRAEEY